MNNQKGFTMVEVLGIITVLVLISLFTFPIITSLIKSTSNDKVEQFLETIYQASETYVEINYDNYKNFENGFISVKKLIDEGYLQKGLINPSTEIDILTEDGIIEITRDNDNSFKYNYTVGEYTNINKIEDLIEILTNDKNYQGKTIILNNDLDFNDNNSYKDINNKVDEINPKDIFKGTFNGNGYKIKNINVTGSDNVGLFSVLDGANIINIKLEGTVSGISNVGLLAGQAINNTKIDRVNIDTTFNYNSSNTSQNVGGIIGYAKNITINDSSVINNLTINGDKVGGFTGTLENSEINNSTQSGFINGKNNIGGAAGYNVNSNISNFSSSGKTFGEENIGGIIGTSTSGKVEFSTNIASVSGTNNIGGIIGSSTNTEIVKNSSLKEVYGTSVIGGIIGYSTGSTITKSVVTSNISGTSIVGGIIGSLNGSSTIENSYSISSIDAQSQVGGISGNASNSTIDKTYYAGSINALTNNNIGGLVGNIQSTSLNNSYYNKELANYEIVGYNTNSTISNSDGLTRMSMQNSDNYTNWDFTNIWQISVDNYPNLR